MKLDTSDCPDPNVDWEGYEAWIRREKARYPAPDYKKDWEAFEQWVIEFCNQTPYRLVPRKEPNS